MRPSATGEGVFRNHPPDDPRLSMFWGAVLGVVLLLAPAAGQAPPAAPKPPTAPKAPAAPQPPGIEIELNTRPAAPKPPTDPFAEPVELTIAAALRTDPDVRIARAKLQLAEAEMGKARLQVAQKVVALRAAIQDQRREVEAAVELVKGGAPSGPALGAMQARRETALASLARLEAEWRALTAVEPPPPANPPTAAPIPPPGPAGRPDAPPATTARQAVDVLTAAREAERQAVRLWHPGPGQGGGVAERVRAALDKPVTLGPRGKEVKWADAVEVFKRDAGLDVTVRVAGGVSVSPVVTDGGTLPVGAWLQLFEDGDGLIGIYVRDYGLFVTDPKGAPPDAVPVGRLWKAMPAPGAKPEPAPSKGP